MILNHVFTMRAAILPLGLLFLASLSAAQSDENATAPVGLVAHRAIYDLSLGTTRGGNSQIAGVRGRILYDFGGNACQGYSLEFRQVSELDSGEGRVSTSDLRSTTWEGADAKSFKL